MSRVAGEQRGGRGHVRRGHHRGVDDRVPVAAAQREQILVPGPVTMQRHGPRPGLAVLPSGEGRHVVTAGNCLVNDGPAHELGAPEHENLHDATFCRSELNSRNALRRELT